MKGDAISRESEGLTEEGFTDFEEFDADCYKCGLTGWIVDDCFEDICCCADPEAEHGVIPCPRCRPDGV